jgi:hypothetical protein
VAAEQEGQYWRDLWGGVSGKPNPENDYERQLNQLVYYEFQYKTQFEDFIAHIYFGQCVRYPGAPSQPR